MQFSHALIALVAAGLANAQLPDVPSCSLNCFVSALTSDGCSTLTDFACHCQKTQLVSDITPCVKKACDTSDQVSVSNIVVSQCSSAGHPISVPPIETTTDSGSATTTSSAPAETSATATETSSASETSSSSESSSSSSSSGSTGATTPGSTGSSTPTGSSKPTSTPLTKTSTGTGAGATATSTYNAGTNVKGNLAGVAAVAAAAAYIL